MRQTLHLYEQIMLLALRDEEGTVASGVECSFTLGGALLAELLLERRLRIDESGKRPLLEVADPTSVSSACGRRGAGPPPSPGSRASPT